MSAAPSISCQSVEDVALFWGLEPQKNGKWSGPHPTDKSIAGSDGFVLCPEGNAFTNSGEHYTSVQVAQMRGIQPDEYEPCRRYRGQSVTSPNPSQSREALIEATLPVAAAAKEFNQKTLEQRGIRHETIQHFFIKKESYKGVDYYEYVTTQASGEMGRNRRKFLDPVAAGKAFDKKQKPMKYGWKPLDSDPIPPAYNLEACIGKVEVWLVGGEVDVWSCWQAGIDAVCGFGETRKITEIINACSDLGIEKIHIALDNDTAGHKGALMAVDACIEAGIAYTVREIFGLVGSDINDMFCRLDHDAEKCKTALMSLSHATKATLDRWRGVEEAKDDKKERPKASSTDEKMQKTERLVHLLHGANIFVGTEDEEFYIGITGDDGIERAYPAGDSNLKADLFHFFFEQTGKAISDEVVSNAMMILKGRARAKNSYRDVSIRSGEYDGKFYVDLADRENNIVEISPEIQGGWRVVKKSEIYFRRPKGMQPLPVPVHGGSLSDVRDVINAEDEDNWRMICGWLIYALCPPKAPYPCLALNGEQGTAKSTTSKILRKCIDPNFTALIGGSIRDERDLAIMAKNSWVLGFDNLSGLNKWQSDALAQIVTEGSFRTRKLRSDEEEILFKATRPIIINGIDAMMGREDFQARCLACSLPVIPESKRQDEATVWEKFYAMWPSLLGAIFTAMSKTMPYIQQVKLEKTPRMADFAKFMVASEEAEAVPWGKGEFLGTYFENLHEIQETSVEYSPLANELVKFANRYGAMKLPATELLDFLNKEASYDVKNTKSWPSSASWLTNTVNRMAVNLRGVGVDVRSMKSNGKRVISIMPISTDGVFRSTDVEAAAYID
jgi:hypothetical protein